MFFFFLSVEVLFAVLTTYLTGEYAYCISVKGVIPHLPHECPGYDAKQSDDNGSSLGALGDVDYLFIAIISSSTLTQRRSIC